MCSVFHKVHHILVSHLHIDQVSRLGQDNAPFSFLHVGTSDQVALGNSASKKKSSFRNFNDEQNTLFGHQKQKTKLVLESHENREVRAMIFGIV